jgi:UDP-N-acetylglucosamine transferase subunit ALG13
MDGEDVGGTRGDPPLLFVTVGADRRPFPRLLRWVGAWAADHPRWRVEVQHAATPAPRFGHAVAYLRPDRARTLLRAAAVVVTQAEPATIAQARAVGHVPVVVPREPGLGEDVDDDQVLLARRLGAAGVVWPVESEAGLEGAITAALNAAAGSRTGAQGLAGGTPSRGTDRGPRSPGRRLARRRLRR